MEHKIPCTLEELFMGCAKKFKISNTVLTVDVRKGWKEGTKIKFENPAITFIVQEKKHSFLGIPSAPFQPPPSPPPLAPLSPLPPFPVLFPSILKEYPLLGLPPPLNIFPTQHLPSRPTTLHNATK